VIEEIAERLCNTSVDAITMYTRSTAAARERNKPEYSPAAAGPEEQGELLLVQAVKLGHN
jgi:hypothetical protein